MNTELDKVTAENLREISAANINREQVALAENELPKILCRAVDRASTGACTVGLDPHTVGRLGRDGGAWLVDEMKARGFQAHSGKDPFTGEATVWWSW